MKKDLFSLIKSLRVSEKRYFMRFAQFHLEREKNRYIHLFEWMNAQEEYDEQAIKQQYCDAGHPTFAANLSFNKNYLYQLILRCLRSFHAQNSARTRLHEMMIDIDILTQKGLLEQAQGVLQKGRQLAREYSLHVLELDLLAMERKIVRQFATQDAAESLEDIQKEYQVKVGRLSKEHDILALYEQVFILARTKNYPVQPLQNLNATIWSVVGNTPEVPNFTFDGVAYFHLLKSQFHRLSKQTEESNHHLRLLLNHFEAHAALLGEAEYQERYLNTLNNYYNSCHILGQAEECLAVMEKIAQINPSNPKMEAAVFHNLHYIRMMYHFQQKEYAQILDAVETIKEGLKKYAANIPKNREMAFRYNLAVAYYFMGSTDKALDWLLTITGDVRQEVRQDIQLLAHIFHLCLHFENGNYLLIENTLPNIRRYLRKRQRQNTPEQKIVDAIGQVIRKGEKTPLSALQTEIEAETGYEEFKEWIKNCLRHH